MNHATISDFITKAHVLFLMDDSSTSYRVEQNLKANNYHVTSVQDLGSLEHEWLNGIHHVMIVGHSCPFSKRLALLDEAREHPCPIPIIMVFDSGASEEAFEAKKRGAAECVLLDDNGEYLPKILALTDILLKKSSLNATKDHLSDESASREENSASLDLTALADEVCAVAADNRDMTLVVVAGPDCGATLRAGRRPCLVGRDPACHLMLRDDSISRFHASFTKESDGIVVVNDLNSKNGTFIDGKRVATARLKKENRVQLGRNTIIAFQ